MARFEPGKLHIERHALNNQDVSYDLKIEYEITQDPKEGKGVQFRVLGSIQGKDVNEPFWLPKIEAYNFARNVTQIAEKYGIPKALSSIGSQHTFYDEMFEDIRAKLDMHSGDAVDIKHFE